MEYVAPLIYPVTDFGRSIGNAFKRAFEHLHDHFIPHPRNNYHPHVLGHRSLALYSMLVVTVKVVALCGPLLFTQVNPSLASAITPTNIFSLTNTARAEFGAAALTQNQKLVAAAEAKAQALLDCQCFSHNITVNGQTKTPWDFIHGAGYNYLTAGENLGIDFLDAESLEQAWMNSPGHKANIVNKSFEEIGIGVRQGIFQGHESIVVVQEFGTQAVEQVAMKQPQASAPVTVASAAEAPPAPVAQKVAGSNSTAASQSPQKIAEAPKPAAPVAVAAAAPVTAPSAEPVPPKIVNTSVAVHDGNVQISIDTAGAISKVIAHLGPEAVMLDAKSDTHWEGAVSLSKVAADQRTVTVSAEDASGVVLSEQVASFNDSMAHSYTPAGTAPTASGTHFTLFGRTFTVNLSSFEKQFYMIFITLILAALVISIAIKRHIQHIGLIAHSAFVVILAVMMFAGI